LKRQRIILIAPEKAAAYHTDYRETKRDTTYPPVFYGGNVLKVLRLAAKHAAYTGGHLFYVCPDESREHVKYLVCLL
jgi:hypothetical protein